VTAVPDADLFRLQLKKYFKKQLWHPTASDLAKVAENRLILKNYQCEGSTVPG
jgi:hypothetical protein